MVMSTAPQAATKIEHVEPDCSEVIEEEGIYQRLQRIVQQNKKTGKRSSQKVHLKESLEKQLDHLQNSARTHAYQVVGLNRPY